MREGKVVACTRVRRFSAHLHRRISAGIREFFGGACLLTKVESRGRRARSRTAFACGCGAICLYIFRDTEALRTPLKFPSLCTLRTNERKCNPEPPSDTRYVAMIDCHSVNSSVFFFFLFFVLITNIKTNGHNENQYVIPLAFFNLIILYPVIHVTLIPLDEWCSLADRKSEELDKYPSPRETHISRIIRS